MSIDMEAPFWIEILSGQTINVNGNPMLTGEWNLLCSKRDLTLWTAKYKDGRPMKIKPHRHWRVTDVKNYLGLKGSTGSLLKQAEQLYKIITKSV